MSYTIYGTPSCSFCVKAKELLDSKGIEYTYLDIQHNLENRNEVMAKVPNLKTVPQIFDGNRHIGGYTELEVFLTNA